MNHSLTIFYFEYANNVLLKENVSTEHKLGFKTFEDAKNYAMNQAYSYFDDISRIVVKLSNANDKIYFFRLQELSGEARYECSVYLKMEE